MEQTNRILITRIHVDIFRTFIRGQGLMWEGTFDIRKARTFCVGYGFTLDEFYELVFRLKENNIIDTKNQVDYYSIAGDFFDTEDVYRWFANYAEPKKVPWNDEVIHFGN